MRDFRLLTAVSSLVFVALGITAPVMTIYLESLGASFAQISLILTSFTLTALLANYLSGRFSDRLGRRKPLLIGGLLLLGFAYFWLARVPTANLAWPVRVVEGVGSGIYATLSLAMMGDLLERSGRRGRRMGIYRGLGSASFALGAVSGGFLSVRFSPPFVFLVAGCCYTAAAGVMLLIHEARGEGIPGGQQSPQPTEEAVAQGREAAGAARAQQRGEGGTGAPDLPLGAPEGYPVRGLGLPVLFLAGVVTWTAAVGAAASMWPNAMAHLGYSQQTISTLWGLAALIELPGMMGAGILSDAVGRAPLLAAGAFGVSLVFLGYVFIAQWLPALIGVQTLRGLSYGSYMASAMTFAAEHGSRRTRGSVSGVYAAATGTGQLAGTFAGGLVVQAFGFTPLFGLCALAALAGGICFLSLHAQTRREIRQNPEIAKAAHAGRVSSH